MRYAPLLVMAWMGGIGFLDDYLKLKQKREGLKNEGLVERYKLAGQITVGLALGLYLWQFPLSTLPGASTTLPFFKCMLIVPATLSLGWLYVAFVTFILTGTSNAVNLTDGLDGLAAGLAAIAAVTFAVFAYVMGRVDTSAYLHIFYLRGAGELTVFCSAIFGACIGFLWYNSHPAQVFMGDTGLARARRRARCSRDPAQDRVPAADRRRRVRRGDGVGDPAAVRVQVPQAHARRGVRARQNRVFLRAPLHHHFELKGWPETQVVMRFWIIGILCAFLALRTLKLR